MSATARHRRMLVIAGERDQCLAAADRLLAGRDALWITDQPRGASDTLPAARAHALLGGERATLVFDAHAGFDVEAFGACAGVVRGGGLFLLLTPPFACWPQQDHAEKARIADYPHPPGAVGGRFLQRFIAVLQAAGVPILRAGDPPPAIPPPPRFDIGRTADQDTAIAAVLQVARGHTHRPLVLLADRGRGKSAALGMAAARLVTEGFGRLVITGPRPAAAETALAHARAALPEATHQGRCLSLGRASLTFAAPDALAAGEVAADLVLVDEAAAIPVPILERLLRRFPRLVFSTTVHGYEGTGRGFAVRFARVLDRLTPGWHELTLHQPVRWEQGDALEALVFRALLLDAEPAPEQALRGGAAIPAVETLDRDRLVEDEALLNEVFGLLVLAHYRTSPMDLRQLLDGPNVSVRVLRSHEHIVGVALVVEEGALPPALAREVWTGRRRVRGHLLAQSLAQHAGLMDAPCLRGRRILRIAVHPAVQGRGLGGRLVQAVVEACRAAGADYVGSSFGATAGLLHFWQRSGFQGVRLGLARDAASGAPSVMVMKPLSTAGEALFAAARRRHADALPHLLAGPLRGLDAPLAGAVLADAGPPPAKRGLDDEDWRDLLTFALGARDFAYVLAPLHRLALHALADSHACSRLSERERDALVLSVLEAHSLTETAARLGLTGRHAATALLRRAVDELAHALGSNGVQALRETFA